MAPEKAVKIEKMVREIYNGNSCFYRNDTGNGTCGPMAIEINDENELQGILGELVGEDARIVNFEERINDITARDFMQAAITAHGDDAIIDDDDLIIETGGDSGDNPYRAYYWVWSY